MGLFSRAAQTKWRRATSPIAPRSVPEGRDKDGNSHLDPFSRMAHAKVKAGSIGYSPAVSARRKGIEWQLAFGPAQPLADAKVDADSIRYNAAIGAWRRHGSGSSHWACSAGRHKPKSRRAPSPIVPRSLPAGKDKVAIALDSFSRMAHAKWRRAPSAIVPQSVPGGRD